MTLSCKWNLFIYLSGESWGSDAQWSGKKSESGNTELDADNWSTNPNVMSVSHKGADSLPKNSSKPRKSSHLFSSFMNACLSSPAMRNADGETLKTWPKSEQKISRCVSIFQLSPGQSVQIEFWVVKNVDFYIICCCMMRPKYVESLVFAYRVKFNHAWTEEQESRRT